MNEYYLESATTYSASGNIDVRETFTYDEQGKLITLTYENPEYGNSRINNYDSFGNKISTSYYSDDLLFRIDTFIYDENNNLVLESHDDNNVGAADGIAEIIYTYTYNENGNLVTKSTDYDADGVADDVQTNTYDESGNLIYDSSGTSYIYDENGNLTLINHSSMYTFGSTSYEYDNNNNLVREIRNITDGVYGTQTTYTYQYDSNDNRVYKGILTEDTSYYGSLYETSFQTIIYNADGDVISHAYDNNNDGIVDNLKINVYIYDNLDNLITEQAYVVDVTQSQISTQIEDLNSDRLIQDLDNDGVVDEIYFYNYDENGSSVSETYFAEVILESYIDYSYLQIDASIVAEDLQSLLTPVYRFYQYEKDHYFYTTDANEVDYIRQQSSAGNLSYNYESESYRVLEDNRDLLTGEEILGVKPIYRFFNTETGAHIYTMDENEKESIQTNLSNYSFEGIAYYAFESEPENLATIAVYRMLDNSSGVHLFTTDQNEIDNFDADLSQLSLENEGNAVFHVVEL